MLKKNKLPEVLLKPDSNKEFVLYISKFHPNKNDIHLCGSALTAK